MRDSGDGVGKRRNRTRESERERRTVVDLLQCDYAVWRKALLRVLV
jgi:hypothetical protein